MISKNRIGLTRTHQDEILAWFDTEFCLWFWFCLYSPEQIANTFEMSDLLIKRRNEELKLLDIICDKTGYTREFFISKIKTSIPKFYKTLPTYAIFKANVESGKFTGIGYDPLRKGVVAKVNTLFSWITNFTRIDETLGCPNFKTDFTRKIIYSSDPEIIPDPSIDPYSTYNPNNTGYTQTQLDAKKLADQEAETERLRQEQQLQDEETAKRKKNIMLFGGGIGLAFLALITIKK